jgi:guanylate kinase
MQSMNQLFIITGPSCVGKSPLVRILHRDYPACMAGIEPLILYNSRDPRPGEQDGIDYHFRAREEIQQMAVDGDCVVMDVRGDLQALDIGETRKQLSSTALLFEGNPFIAEVLQTHEQMEGVPRKSLFVSPLSLTEIRILAEKGTSIQPAAILTDIMRRKLLRRTRRHKGELSLGDLENIERRAGSAWRELRMAPTFDGVLANHDGEDSENWEAFPIPIGEAGRAVRAVHNWLTDRKSPEISKWEVSLFKELPES